MKKLLLTALFALAILLPVTATVEAADVPDFERIGSEIFFSSSQRNGDDSVTYFFKAQGLSESRADAYIGQFIRLLTSNNFVQTGYEKKKFERKRVQATRQSEKWTFRYTGTKSVWSLSDGNHIHMRRIRNKQNGDTSFEIRLAKGLTIDGNYGSPKPSGGNGQRECSECNGSGRCRHCGGSGRETRWVGDGYQDAPCTHCWNGKCRDCGGTGYR